VGAERGFLPRREAAERTLTALRFFRDRPQGAEPDATGHRGFYYHVLDMKTGRRVKQCAQRVCDYDEVEHLPARTGIRAGHTVADELVGLGAAV
jgi:hypothetical protein